MKLVCYGVRETEIPFFEKFNKYSFELMLVPELMNDENVELAKDADAVVVRGNCKTNATNIERLHSLGVKYLLTRTVGYNHIDLEATKKHGMRVARVPSYSPNAIGELAVTLAMMLLRHVAYTVNKTRARDFTVDATMFSKEVRNCTVGILGAGKIGLTTAKLFKGLGSNVVAYDIFESDEAKEVVEFMTLDELLAVSDIVSVHMPYIKGENDRMLDKDFLAKMKQDAILINTSRGELQNDDDILAAILENTLGAFGTDVFAHEADFFFKDMKGKALPDPAVEKLLDCYPKVLVTPHIGAYTDEALTNMIEITFDNFNEFITTGICENEI